ncbi:MAG: T9SS type A sorting domain-containing protein [Melioribacteraceae bacterium]
MNLVNKLFGLLFYCLLVTKVFPQGESHISLNGNINNSVHTRSIYNISTLTPLKKNNSVEVLDSLVYISTNNDRKRIAYNYNDDLSLNYFINAGWYNGEWINTDKHTNSYNSDRNIESVLWEWINTSSGEWLKDAKDVYNYDSLGNRIFSLHQYFNEQEFVNQRKYENYFNGTNLMSSRQQSWIDSKWVNSFKTINTFTSDNLKDSTLFQKWINNQWVNSQISIYEYDENDNMISIRIKIEQEEQWIDYAVGVFEYDVNNNLVLENWQITGNNNWENWFRVFYVYNSHNNLIHLFGEEWKNDQWVSENEQLKVTNPDGILYGYLAKEVFLFYRNLTSVRSKKNISGGFNLLQNYPNPFNPTTTITYQLKDANNVNLKVYDVLGKEVAELINEIKSAGVYNISFNASNLPSGLYFYRIQAGEFTAVRKMLLMK